MNKSYCRKPGVGDKGGAAWQMTLTMWFPLAVQLKSRIPARLEEKWISRPSMVICRFPDVMDQTTVTSCSSPRQSVPIFPSSKAALLGKPNRLQRENKSEH